MNRSSAEVFAFTTDPQNTPKWIDFIAEERANEFPPKLGTIYENRGGEGGWRELRMTAFEKNRSFTLSSSASGYNVRYTFTPVSDTETELEYYEWMDDGELEEPFDKKYLEKLKAVLEDS